MIIFSELVVKNDPVKKDKNSHQSLFVFWGRVHLPHGQVSVKTEPFTTKFSVNIVTATLGNPMRSCGSEPEITAKKTV